MRRTYVILALALVAGACSSRTEDAMPTPPLLAPSTAPDPDVQLAEWMTTEGVARIERVRAACIPLAACSRPAEEPDPRGCIPRRILDCETALRMLSPIGTPDAARAFLEEERARRQSAICYARASLAAFEREPALVDRVRRSGRSLEEWGYDHGGAARDAKDAINACPEEPSTATFDDWAHERWCCTMYPTARDFGARCTLDRLAAMHAAAVWPPPRSTATECAGSGAAVR